MTRLMACAALLIAPVFLAHAGAAQSPARVARGQRLAQAYCAQCHVIVRNGPAGWTDAPSFASIADRPEVTAAWLEGVMAKPHVHMMYLPAGPADASALAAYILSLRERK